jgi:hypothetical protein
MKEKKKKKGDADKEEHKDGVRLKKMLRQLNSQF